MVSILPKQQISITQYLSFVIAQHMEIVSDFY